MFPVGFEPMISAGERPQTYALDRAAIILHGYKMKMSDKVSNPYRTTGKIIILRQDGRLYTVPSNVFVSPHNPGVGYPAVRVTSFKLVEGNGSAGLT